MAATPLDKPLTVTGVKATGIGAASSFNVKTLEVKSPAFVRAYDVESGVLKDAAP